MSHGSIVVINDYVALAVLDHEEFYIYNLSIAFADFIEAVFYLFIMTIFLAQI